MSQLVKTLIEPSRLRVYSDRQRGAPGVRWASADILAFETASSTQSCVPGPAGSAPSVTVTSRQSPGLLCGIWLAANGPDVGAGLPQAASAQSATTVKAAR